MRACDGRYQIETNFDEIKEFGLVQSRQIPTPFDLTTRKKVSIRQSPLGKLPGEFK